MTSTVLRLCDRSRICACLMDGLDRKKNRGDTALKIRTDVSGYLLLLYGVVLLEFVVQVAVKKLFDFAM